MWKKGSSLEEEISHDEFDTTVFIDRVFTRTSGESRDSNLDVSKFKSNFELIINNLQVLRSQVNNRANILQNKCKMSEMVFKNELKQLQKQIGKIDDDFQCLDEGVHQVSGKVVLLGDQLERKSNPRIQLLNAKEVIFEFFKYLNGTVNQDLSIDDEEDILLNAAERIQRLSAICLELPDDDKFIPAKNRVTMAQEEIDLLLSNKFKVEWTRENTDSMRRIVGSLRFSKKFSSFISSFVEQSVKKISIHQDLTGNLISLCTDYNQLIEIVFPNHYTVMLQYLQAIFTGPLKKNIEDRIPKAVNNRELYLQELYLHYVRLDDVIKKLTMETFIQDSSALSKLFKELFASYLGDYIIDETQWLKDRLESHLITFYSLISHTRKQINEGGFVDLYRDLQARFMTTGVPLGDDRDVSYQKLLLSQEVAVNILEDAKTSCKRAKTLSASTSLSDNIVKILDCLSEHLIIHHLNYGLCYSVQGVLSADTKKEPSLLYLQVVHEANNIFQFFDKAVSDTILPLIIHPDRHAESLQKRQNILRECENKINQGLEKLTSLCLGYIHYVLSTEQKKSDFKPDLDSVNNQTTSPAAEKVVSFLKKLPSQIELFLDGQNKDVFCQEFGLQFHRLIMDHFYNFSYSCEGGYVAMQDVNLYDEVMRRFNCPLLNGLFNTLLRLMNIVSMKPENLKSIIASHLETGIPKELLNNFVHLRSDQKTTRLLVDLK